MKLKNLLCLLPFLGGLTVAASPVEDADVDRRMGILNRPWEIYWYDFGSLGDRRRAIGLDTGSPPYDRQVERALNSPVELIESLRPAPAPRKPSVRVKPKPVVIVPTTPVKPPTPVVPVVPAPPPPPPSPNNPNNPNPNNPNNPNNP